MSAARGAGCPAGERGHTRFRRATGHRGHTWRIRRARRAAVRCDVVAVDVEQDVGAAARRPGGAGRAAAVVRPRPPPWAVGRDAEDVHLAGAVRVQLGPVEGDELAVPVGEQEAGGVEPRLGEARREVALRPPSLLGVVGERRGVEGQPARRRRGRARTCAARRRRAAGAARAAGGRRRSGRRSWNSSRARVHPRCSNSGRSRLRRPCDHASSGGVATSSSSAATASGSAATSSPFAAALGVADEAVAVARPGRA